MQAISLGWSGGKDSALTLYRIRKNPAWVLRALHTVLPAPGGHWPHAVPVALLQAQAAALELPLQLIRPPQPDNAAYAATLADYYRAAKVSGVTAIAQGDIFLEDLRAYKAALIEEVGLQPLFPLWKEDPATLAHEFLAAGFQAVVCSAADPPFGPAHVGKPFDGEWLAQLPPGVDAAGESGAFHTFVHDGPIFQNPIGFGAQGVTKTPFNIRHRTGQAQGSWHQLLLSAPGSQSR